MISNEISQHIFTRFHSGVTLLYRYSDQFQWEANTWALFSPEPRETLGV